MRAEEGMTGAELATVCGYLGLTAVALMDVLNDSPYAEGEVSAERAVRRWFTTPGEVPEWVREEIERIETRTATEVGKLVERVMSGGDTHPDIGVVTYRTNQDFWDHRPDMRPWPASWHRQVVARVAHEIPGLRIIYWERSE